MTYTDDAWLYFMKLLDIDYLKTIKKQLTEKKKITHSSWVMDCDHVTAVTKIREEVKDFLKDPTEGWMVTNYHEVKHGYGRPKGFPMYNLARLKQVEYWLRAHWPGAFKSEKRRKNIKVLYLKDHPVIFWPEGYDMIALMSPEVVIGVKKK